MSSPRRLEHARSVLILALASSACAAAPGEVVGELDDAITCVFQASNHDYWFGSNQHGAYRYDGRTLLRFTTDDGLPGNSIRGIQEDGNGRIYISTYEGVARFGGRRFTALSVAADSSASAWKLTPDDLWFVGPPDTGTALRFDGERLHRLAFPATADGDAFLAEHPRSLYPNAKYSPYDVFSVFQDSRGHVWFGTAILGACRYDGESHAWIPESQLRNGSFGTRSIVEDREGRFWFCNTLHRYAADASDPAAPQFRQEEGLRDAADPRRARIAGIMASTLDRAGDLWMATYGDGVWRWDGTAATHYPVRNGEAPVTLFTIHQDRQGGLWLGTQDAGAYRFDGEGFAPFEP